MRSTVLIIARCQAIAAAATVPALEGSQADRQQRRAPSTVAPAGAETDVTPFDDDDAKSRIGARASANAVHSPVYPAPTTATSTVRSPSSGRETGREAPGRSPTTGSAGSAGHLRLRYADDFAAGGHVRPAAQRSGGLVSGPLRQRLRPLLRRLPLDAIRRHARDVAPRSSQSRSPTPSCRSRSRSGRSSSSRRR